MLYVEQDAVEAGELLMADDFSGDDLTERWEVTGGEWSEKDGVLTGVFRGNAGGLIYSRQGYMGDILLDFYGRMLSPCDNDLNWTFRARGWDHAKDDADVSYIAGLNGWWVRRTGIERYPECALRALTQSFTAESDRWYHIQSGIVKNTAFLAVDGQMIMTLNDPDPICAADCSRVGLGTYCSQVQFRDFKLYRPRVTAVDMFYTPKF